MLYPLLGKEASQSSNVNNYFAASRAIDGNVSMNGCIETECKFVWGLLLLCFCLLFCFVFVFRWCVLVCLFSRKWFKITARGYSEDACRHLVRHISWYSYSKRNALFLPRIDYFCYIFSLFCFVFVHRTQLGFCNLKPFKLQMPN